MITGNTKLFYIIAEATRHQNAQGRDAGRYKGIKTGKAAMQDDTRHQNGQNRAARRHKACWGVRATLCSSSTAS